MADRIVESHILLTCRMSVVVRQSLASIVPYVKCNLLLLVTSASDLLLSIYS